MERLMRFVSSYGAYVLSKDNVVGVGVGFKETAGRSTGRLAVVVLVTKKVPIDSIPRSQAIPRQINSVHTDVLEVGEIVLLSRLTRVRPAVPGVSIGHHLVTAGTFGAVVKDEKTQVPLILSNNHVLANITDGRDGRSRKGDPIYQPGRVDGGASEDTVAYLERFVPVYRAGEAATCSVAKRVERAVNWALGIAKPNYHIRLYRSVKGENLVDAAVARPVSPEIISPEIMDIGEVTSAREATLGERVIKSGRTSGVSAGEVKVVGATLKVLMGDVGSAVFTDQIVTTPMAQPGDSGSLLVSLRREALGLVSAGSDKASIAGKIGHVMNMLKVTI
ncbi:MAG: hypothetical protein AB1576_08530 [Bacillota bacterium]